MADVSQEVKRLLAEGKAAAQVRVELEEQGFYSEDIAAALQETGQNHQADGDDRRNGRLFATREIFDRIGYGGATPQFVNIIFWMSAQTHHSILLLIGLLNGCKTILSVVLSNLLQEYHKLHRSSKNTIASAGIMFGFSFLVMSFALLLPSPARLWVFSIAFLVGAVGVVAYGDMYHEFMHAVLRRERMGPFLRSVAHWGVIITAVSLILSGLFLDLFPITGTPWTFTLFGNTFNVKVYGHLLAFEMTAVSFIIAGYVISLVQDRRERMQYAFWQFFAEHRRIVRHKLSIFRTSREVRLLTAATATSGLLQVLITAYSGIAIYRLLDTQQVQWPFLTLAVIYGIAIIASFTGPFFTERVHRAIGLAPTMVFGTLLLAIFPLTLVFNATIAAITAGLCMYVIGGAISGYGQGLLAQKLLSDEVRRDYFRAQSYVVFLPYLLLIPVLSWIANMFPLRITFLIVAGGMVLLVLPLYLLLVWHGQHRTL